VPKPVTPEPAPAPTPEQTTAEFLANTFDLLELDPVDFEPIGVKAAVAEPVVVEPALAQPAPAEAVFVEPVFQQAAMPELPVIPLQDQDFEPFEFVLDSPEPEVPVHMPPVNPALLGLERFLEAIHSYRQQRAV
jgi:hypothetical protein